MKWQIDRKIPLAILIGLIVNGAIGIWYAAKLDSRIGFMEQQLAEVKADVKTLNGYLMKMDVSNAESKLNPLR